MLLQNMPNGLLLSYRSYFHGSRAARFLGGTLQVAGNEEPFHSFGCWTASTKAGLISRAGKSARKKEALPWRPF